MYNSQCSAKNKNIYIKQAKNQEKVPDNHKVKQSLEADPETIQILELALAKKDFKITVINMFKKMESKMGKWEKDRLL